METDIHKSLAQLQGNLVKLQSAREQVEQVTAGGKALTEQAAALLGETGQLVGTLNAEIRELLELFAGKMSASEERIGRVVEERSALIGGTLDEMKQVFADTETTVRQAVAGLRSSAEETLLQVTQEQKGQLNNFQVVLDGKLGHTLTEFQSKLLQFETSVQKLVCESSAAVNEVAGLSARLLAEQEREVNTLLSQLEETDRQARTLLGYIREQDLAAKWLSLESEMKTFRQEILQNLAAADARMETLRKAQTWLFYALGALGLLLLVLKFV